VLDAGGLPKHSGLAMGVGLDRAVMPRKGVTDIRLLRDRIYAAVHEGGVYEWAA
jgi:phenylalanyl-tRNA synthetase alpha subunit